MTLGVRTPLGNLTQQARLVYDGYVHCVEFGPNGIDGRCVLHSNEWEQVINLVPGHSFGFKDEQGINWVVTYVGDKEYLFDSRYRGLAGYIRLPNTVELPIAVNDWQELEERVAKILALSSGVDVGEHWIS